MINLQQLETFRLIEKHGSFTRAARALNATQSTVSMRISQLEQTFGVQLLDRSSRTIRLTVPGQRLLEYANKFSQLTAEMIRNVRGDEGVRDVRVKIGVAELIALTWLPVLLDRLRQHHPHLQIEIEVGLSVSMFERLRNQEFDICLHPSSSETVAGLDATLLGRTQFAFMGAPRLDVPNGPFRPAQLARLPLISFGPESALDEILEGWFERAGVEPPTMQRSNSMEVTAGLVRSGLGASLLPVGYYQAQLDAGHLALLDVRPKLPPVSFFAVHEQSNASELVASITDIAKDAGAFDA